MGNKSRGDVRKRKAKDRVGRAYVKAYEEKGKTLLKATWLVKYRTAFWYWEMELDTCNGSKGLEEEEEEGG
jgi:hypothetical protein